MTSLHRGLRFRDDDSRDERDEAGVLVTVHCDFHGTSVPHPRHGDIHHTAQCPTVTHCAWCWHGAYLVVACDCPALEDVEPIDLMFEKVK